MLQTYIEGTTALSDYDKRHFQHLAGTIYVCVDMKYDVLCL